MTLAVNLAQGASNNVTFRNKIINGNMVIDQRNAGASVTPVNDGYMLDRWKYNASQASKFTVQQNAGSVTPPVGFSNYMGFTVASAVTVGATDNFMFSQRIEGFNFADLNWGTANAKTVTLSFQVYSSLTGTFGGSLQNSAENRSYPFTYSISSANTWTTISVTVAGDTSGTWIGATNGVGLKAWFSLGMGSTYSGTAGAWAGATYFSATGATSVVGTSGATFYITGVQLEAGTTASPFEYRQYGTELALCQRYYQKFNGSQYLNESIGVAAATTVIYYNKPFTSMRAAPTFSSSGTFNADGTSYSTVTLSMPYASTETARVDGTGSGFTAGQAYALTHQSTNSYLQFTAEL